MGVQMRRGPDGLPADAPARMAGITTPCRIWPSRIDRTTGYGIIFIYGKGKGKVWAHREVWEAFNGPIPKGLVLDHLCRVKACVEPTHLEPVTQTENHRRGINYGGRNALKTHCWRGHVFDERNTGSTQEGHRRCRKCMALRQRQYRAAAKAKAL
jgi:hypothetical protein